MRDLTETIAIERIEERLQQLEAQGMAMRHTISRLSGRIDISLPTST